MMAGVAGRLLSSAFIRDVLPTLPGVSALPPDVGRSMTERSRRIEASLGSASSVRAVTDIALIPLAELLRLTLVQRRDTPALSFLRLVAGPRTELVAVAAGWGEPLEPLRRSIINGAIDIDARWCLYCDGRTLRIIDARRTWSRDYLEFDLTLIAHDAEAQWVLWTIANSGALSSTPPLLDRAVELSSRHGVQVCRALGAGMLEALETLFAAIAHRHPPAADVLWEQALTVLYRVLFLLFAEARGLVPIWHPIYRDRYSLEVIVSTLLDGRRYRGLWRAVQAISRLAHSGCSAGELKVTAFNGRLFAPAQATSFDRSRLSDTVMSRAVVALSSTPTTRHGGRARIAYRDLDVEQLGAVYEHVLDYEPASAKPGALERTRDTRKSSGTFYTPRRVTALLVDHALAPLVKDRSADDILRVRVIDPAMGSGAFLVACCRYLASSVEAALVREGRWHAQDVTPADRAGLRREVASRCLFGVDRNPMAVQLARLSIWLATLAADKPLSFLDHHLLTGDSLVGASPHDVTRQPGGGHRRGRPERLPLFDDTALPSALAQAAQLLSRISAEPDDTAAIVRSKERRIEELRSSDSYLAKWTRVLDLWCSGWFWRQGSPPDRGAFLDLMARLLEQKNALPARVATELLEASQQVASCRRFLHWPLAFPDVFLTSDDSPSVPGFDAVVGNPPWDMVRGDSGAGDARDGRRLEAHQMTRFIRESGIYHVGSRAHLNLYQLFIERALQLVKPGGRIGLVVPSGLVSDGGAAPFRRHLFDRADVDEVTGFDNRHAIFPVHRSVRFVLLTCSPGRPTSSIRCRFGLTSPEELEAPGPAPLILSRRFLAKVSGEDDLGIPELSSECDLAIVEAISTGTPRLGSTDGWHVAFGRELNASDDRDLLVPVQDTPGRPVVEGKQIEPFRVALHQCRLALRPDADLSVGIPRRARLAYRDVASAGNRLTLIAAIVPARAVTTHTLFCLRTMLPVLHQRVLCALLNSYVANYLVRLRVNTHVTVSLISRLPVPLLQPTEPSFERLNALSDALTSGTTPVEEMDEYHELQAIAARLYGLTSAQFEHVLTTFPLVPETVRQKVLARFKSSPGSRHGR